MRVRTRLYAPFDGKHQITRKNQESHPIDGFASFLHTNTTAKTRVNQPATEQYISLPLHLPLALVAHLFE